MTELQFLPRFIKHVRQQVLAATDEHTRGLRCLILTLAEERLRQLQMYQNLTGQLWYDQNFSPNTPQDAVNAFYRNPGLRDHTPLAAHLNPTQAGMFEPEIEVETQHGKLTLTVVSNPATHLNHIWICFPDEPEPQPARLEPVLEVA